MLRNRREIAARNRAKGLTRSPKPQSFLDEDDLACGLQIINADGL
jgi:hypothetical protein